MCSLQEYFLGFCSGSGSRFCFEVLGSVSGPEFLGLLGLGVLKAKGPHAFQKVLSLGFKSPYCYQGSYDFFGVWGSWNFGFVGFGCSVSKSSLLSPY